jgi:hypothetical protein
MNTQKEVFNKLFKEKTELATQKIELGLVDDLIKDAGIAEGKLKSLINLVARRETDFKKIESVADEIGIKLNSKIIEAGKFFRDLEKKLK